MRGKACFCNPKGLNILVLSGGGRNGAWGAGVLCGWRESRLHPRPEQFDVVTGVSTGSLQATYAFLGTPDDDRQLREAYTHVGNEDIFREKNVLYALAVSDSLADTKPLKATLKKFITDETIDRVAKEAGERSLYVATVNLDCGEVEIWDMVAISRSKDPRHYDRYRDVLLAAASVPVVFPPVEIDGYLHVDGGLRELVLLRDFLIPACEAPKGAAGVKPPHLYVLANSGLGIKPKAVPDRLPAIAMRCMEAVADETLYEDLVQIKALADRYPGPEHMPFRMSLIPAALVPEGGSEEFDRAVMNRLFTAGEESAREGHWEREVPPRPTPAPHE